VTLGFCASATLGLDSSSSDLQANVSVRHDANATTIFPNEPFLGSLDLLSLFWKLSFPRQGTLDERAVLLVKFAEHTQQGTVVYHAATLASTTCVTGSLTSCPDIGNCSNRGGGFVWNGVLFHGHGPLDLRTSSCDRYWTWTWHDRRVGDDRRHIGER